MQWGKKKGIVPKSLSYEEHDTSAELVAVSAVGFITRYVETVFWEEFCFANCGYVDLVRVHEKFEFCFLFVDGVCVP